MDLFYFIQGKMAYGKIKPLFLYFVTSLNEFTNMHTTSFLYNPGTLILFLYFKLYVICNTELRTV